MEHFKGKDYFYVKNLFYNRIILNNNDENNQLFYIFMD